MTTEQDRCWIGTSWKMNKTIEEARAYITELVPVLPVAGVQAFVLPPHTALAAVRDQVPDQVELVIGAQNAHWAPEGAGTGEVSMRMVGDAGAQIVEMGHSERRDQFGETDETVAKKAKSAVEQGLRPLICVGETTRVRASGGEVDHVLAQVRAATRLLTSSQISRCLVAYEPVWAIGETGEPATPPEVSHVMAAMAEELGRHAVSGRRALLLYGGGVNPDNAAEMLRLPVVGGLFVGRAAWTAEGLIELLRIGSAVCTKDGASGTR